MYKHERQFRLSSCSNRESEWARIQATAATKTLMLGQIKMATHNLFSLMYKHLQRKIPARDMDDTALQLDKVRDRGRVILKGGHDIVYNIQYLVISLLQKPPKLYRELVYSIDNLYF